MTEETEICRMCRLTEAVRKAGGGLRMPELMEQIRELEGQTRVPQGEN
ncbi:MAG: hypothetical protein HXX11_07260 [Desulfuromonadales bacterium]|nr:hypothetical protein [Desulfuromonadales bacterium]